MRGLLLVLLLSGSVARAQDVTPSAGAPVREAAPARRKEVLAAVLLGVGGLAVTSAYTAGAFVTGDAKPGSALAITGGVISAGLAGAFIGLWINWRRQEPSSLMDYVLAPLVGGLAGALVGGVLSGVAATPPGPGRTVTHVVVVSLLFCETAGVVTARLLD